MSINRWDITGCGLSFFTPKLIPCFLPFPEDFQIRVPDSRLHISTNSERKWNIYISKSKFGCWQPDRNKFWTLKMSLLFNSSLNTLRSFLTHSVNTVSCLNCEHLWKPCGCQALLNPQVMPREECKSLQSQNKSSGSPLLQLKPFPFPSPFHCLPL